MLLIECYIDVLNVQLVKIHYEQKICSQFFLGCFCDEKCSHCSTKIPKFYPILELTCWLLFMFSFWFTVNYLWYTDFMLPEFWINFIFFIVINWILALIFFGDILFYELNIYLWVFLAVWIILFQGFGLVWDFSLAFKGWIVLTIIFLSIYYLSKYYVKLRFGEDWEGFWWWDVMVWYLIGMLMPIILTFNDLSFSREFYPILILYILISSLLWIVFAIINMLFNKWDHWQSIPFLPAMIVGYWIILVYWDKIFDLFDSLIKL